MMKDSIQHSLTAIDMSKRIAFTTMFRSVWTNVSISNAPLSERSTGALERQTTKTS